MICIFIKTTYIICYLARVCEKNQGRCQMCKSDYEVRRWLWVIQVSTGWNLCTLPLRVPPVEVHEVPGLHAAGTGEPAAGGAAQRAPLHRHIQTLRVVHRLRHHTGGQRRVGEVRPERRPPHGVRAGGRRSSVRAERRESRWGRHGANSELS